MFRIDDTVWTIHFVNGEFKALGPMHVTERIVRFFDEDEEGKRSYVLLPLDRRSGEETVPEKCVFNTRDEAVGKSQRMNQNFNCGCGRST